MHFHTTSERSRAHLKPRFPRLTLMQRRRRDDDILDPDGRRHKWYCQPDADGLVHIYPLR